MQASKCPVASFERDICNQGYPYDRCKQCGRSKTNLCGRTQEAVVSEAASHLYHGKSYEEVAKIVAPKIRQLVDIGIAERIDEHGKPVGKAHSVMLFAYVVVSVPSMIFAGSYGLRYLVDFFGS